MPVYWYLISTTTYNPTAACDIRAFLCKDDSFEPLMMGVMYTSPVLLFKALHLCNHIGRREMRRTSLGVVVLLQY